MPDTAGLVVAALGGAAVGLERQWSGHADGPGARFAGIRTFTLFGVIAGLSGWLSAAGFVPAAGSWSCPRDLVRARSMTGPVRFSVAMSLPRRDSCARVSRRRPSAGRATPGG